MYVCYMSLGKVVKTTYQFVNMVIGEGRGSEVREISADGRRKAKLQWWGGRNSTKVLRIFIVSSKQISFWNINFKSYMNVTICKI